MRVMVLGGDGFCGWPTALHLSDAGHDVLIVDNLSRRNIDNELGAGSLTPIATIDQRLAAWEQAGGNPLGYEFLDVAKNYHRLLSLLLEWKPDTIIHFAEQRAAPYSMKSSWHKRYTVENNVSASHNVLAAIVESGRDIHLVHLGTMGVYGYGTAGMKIPEGYLEVEVEPQPGVKTKTEILYPANPGSVYHMTKTLDQLLFAYYNKNDGVRITDLHQGIVWGTHTPETARHPRLVNRFDYDGDYGTVLNRFLMQAAIGYPLTVHGTGGQTRAFIHIRDSVNCVRLAAENPPEQGERVRIFNQTTETHRVVALAELISKLTGADISFVQNPRNEAPENELEVHAEGLIGLGLEPTYLAEGLLSEVADVARKYADRCDREKIPACSTWTAQQKPATEVVEVKEGEKVGA